MKRTNEAFKNEVFHRYRTTLRNRRNLRIYTATTLMLCILVVGIAVPLVTGSSLLEAAAALFDTSPLKSYLNQETDQILMEKNCPGAIRSADNEEVIQSVKQALRQLDLTESAMPATPMQADRDPKWAFDLTFGNMGETRFLIGIDQQYLFVFEGNEDFTVPENATWYALSAKDAEKLYDTLNEIYEKNTKMYSIKREIDESSRFTSAEINTAMDAALQGWEENYWPKMYLTTMRYSDDLFNTIYQAEYGVDLYENPDHLTSTPEVIYFYCEWQRVANPNADGPIQSYLRAEKQNGKWVFTDFFPHWGNYFENHPTTNEPSTNPEIPTTDETIAPEVFRSYLDLPMKEIRYQFIPDDLVLRSISEPSEIAALTAKLKQLSLTPQPAIELLASGPDLDLHLEDGRTIQLKLDSDGWMRFILRDAEQKILQSQWYSLPKSNVESIRQYLIGLTAPETDDPPVTTEPPETGDTPEICAHSYSLSQTQNPTCSTSGSQSYTCTKCGDAYTETIPKTTHVYKDATCFAPQTCTICHETQGEALVHNYQNGVCTICGSSQPGEGLAFELNEDGKSYAVIGMGTCTDTDLVIPNVHEGLPVTRIGESAFDQHYDLVSVIVPQGVTTIEDWAFGGCTSLTRIDLPAGLLSIGSYAFAGCQSLTEIELPNSVTSLGDNAFSCCFNLTTVNIPTGLTKIELWTFLKCYSLTAITIPNGVTSIGNAAFSECYNLKSVIIPDSVRSISLSAFAYCTGLESVTLSKNLTVISENLFLKCTNLRSVNIPEGVEIIKQDAFNGCENLQSITIPNQVKEIGKAAFANCKSLESIIIPDSVTQMDDKVFAGCTNLTYVVLPSSLYTVGEAIFNNLPALQSIYCGIEKPTPKWSEDWLKNCTATVYWKDQWEYASGIPTAK